MELHQLRTFVVVAEERNVTRAAKRLFMTPPAVSGHIKALEEELNVTLFIRTPHGMEITDKGTLLRLKAEQTLRAAQDLVNHATQMQDYLIGRLTIGLNASSALLRVAPLISQMREDCPGIDLAFMAASSGKVIDALQGHHLDAGFIFGASPLDSIAATRLTTVDLVVAGPKQWEAELGSAQWADVAEMPWIYSSGYCPFQDIVDSLFQQRQLAYQRIAQADDESTKCELVSAGVGLALLERGEAEQAASTGSLVIWPCEPISCDLSFAIARDRQDDPLVGALGSKVQALWKAP